MPDEMTDRILKGDVRAAAALMTLIENGDLTAQLALKALYPHTGRAQIIGVTGPAGTGKSSLIDVVTAEYRRRGREVGILAVDPSSPFTHGAVLGDRVRMREHFLDRGVFIRSFASRGKKGGLAAAVRDAIHVLDAMGKEIVLVETLGVGQDETEIASLAHLVLVVLMPEMGDEVQALKAGFAEIGDVLVINKSDLPGAQRAANQLRSLFADSDCLVLSTSALKNEGIQELVDAIERHRTETFRNGVYEKKRLELSRQELVSHLRDKVVAELEGKIGKDALLAKATLIAERRIDPYSAAEELARQAGF